MCCHVVVLLSFSLCPFGSWNCATLVLGGIANQRLLTPSNKVPLRVHLRLFAAFFAQRCPQQPLYIVFSFFSWYVDRSYAICGITRPCAYFVLSPPPPLCLDICGAMGGVKRGGGRLLPPNTYFARFFFFLSVRLRLNPPRSFLQLFFDVVVW
jgi:hypothetical protein